MNELALFAQYHNKNSMAWWFMLFLRTFRSVTAVLTLLNVCNIGANFSFLS